MKISLPLKLGIAVVVLFGLLIAGMLLYGPLKERMNPPPEDIFVDVPEELQELAWFLSGRMSLSCVDMPLSEVVSFLQDITGLNIAISKKIDSDLPVSFQLKAAILADAFQAICRCLGENANVVWGIVLEKEGNWKINKYNRIWFCTAEEIKSWNEGVGSRITRIDFSKVKGIERVRAMLDEYKCPFGLDSQEVKAVGRIQEKLKKSFEIRNIKFTFKSLFSFIEKETGVRIQISNGAKEKIEKHQTEEFTFYGKDWYKPLLSNVSSIDLGYLLTPRGILIVPDYQCFFMRRHAEQYKAKKTLKENLITVDFVNCEVCECINLIQNMTLLNIVALPEVDSCKSITYKASRMSAEYVLKGIGDKAGFDYEIEGGIIYLVPEKKK